MATKPIPEDRIMPAPERFQHDILDYIEVTLFSEIGGRPTSKAMTHRVRTQRTIDTLHHKGVLSENQFGAAQRLWNLAYRARQAGSARIPDLGAVVSARSFWGGSSDVDARIEFRLAMEAVPARLRATLKWVVVDDMALRYLAARRGGTRAVALAAVRAELIEGLDSLARFWRL